MLHSCSVSDQRPATATPATDSGEPDASLPFGGTPGCALAVPIVRQGVTPASIYADDSDHVEFATGAPQGRIKFAELRAARAAADLGRAEEQRRPSRVRRDPFGRDLAALLGSARPCGGNIVAMFK
jgi:hypothetical protein